MGNDEPTGRHERRSWFEWCLFAFLAVVVLDIASLFATGLMHWALAFKVSLAIFVYVQMGLTAASVLSIPGTMLARAWSGIARARG